MYSSNRGQSSRELVGLPSDTFYTVAPLSPAQSLVWAKRVWRIAVFVGLITAAAHILAVAVGVGPMFFGFRTFVVVSGSMEPTIATGSIAIAVPVPSRDLQIGDVIAFSPSSEAVLPIIHRIVKIEERDGTRYFTTRGDANTGDDAQLALPPTGLRVIKAIPFVGYATYYAAQPLGTLVLVWVPLLLLLALWLKDRVVTLRQTRRA